MTDKQKADQLMKEIYPKIFPKGEPKPLEPELIERVASARTDHAILQEIMKLLRWEATQEP